MKKLIITLFLGWLILSACEKNTDGYSNGTSTNGLEVESRVNDLVSEIVSGINEAVSDIRDGDMSE